MLDLIPTAAVAPVAPAPIHVDLLEATRKAVLGWRREGAFNTETNGKRRPSTALEDSALREELADIEAAAEALWRKPLLRADEVLDLIDRFDRMVILEQCFEDNVWTLDEAAREGALERRLLHLLRRTPATRPADLARLLRRALVGTRTADELNGYELLSRVLIEQAAEQIARMDIVEIRDVATSLSPGALILNRTQKAEQVPVGEARMVPIKGTAMSPALRPGDFAYVVPVDQYSADGLYAIEAAPGAVEIVRCQAMFPNIVMSRDEPGWVRQSLPVTDFLRILRGKVAAIGKVTEPALLERAGA